MAHAAVKKRCLVVLAAVVITAVSLMFRSPDSAEVVVLMYHHVADVGDGSVTVSADKLDADFSTLSQLGYSSVSIEELISFVDCGTPLPDKSVLIVFDDGYESNYTKALPIIEKYGVKAAVGVIGSAVGRADGAIPHFTWEQASEMEASTHVTIISHTYDMHMVPGQEASVYRPTASARPDESADEFKSAFRADHKQMTALMRSNLGHAPIAFAYPHGISDPTAEAVLADTGVRVTFTTEAGVNIIEKGRPETLRLMKRYNVNETVDIREILCQ